MAPLDRQKLCGLLDFRPHEGVSPGKTAIREPIRHDGFLLERFSLERPGAGPLPCLVLRPDREFPLGGLVYCHAHGFDYETGKEEVVVGRPALLDPPLGLWLARRGYCVVCPDMPGFGERRGEGGESALAKAALWQGRTLLGDMLADLGLALDWLRREPSMDGVPCASIGFSMGATLSYFLAALREDLAACVHACAFADIGPLVASGAHDLHAPYMTVPGLLPDFDMSHVACLVAPRPQLVCSGLRDPLTPPEALEPALDRLAARYKELGASEHLAIHTEVESGHVESTAMRESVDGFLSVNLAT